jgi:hypothetical protein
LVDREVIAPGVEFWDLYGVSWVRAMVDRDVIALEWNFGTCAEYHGVSWVRALVDREVIAPGVEFWDLYGVITIKSKFLPPLLDSFFFE